MAKTVCFTAHRDLSQKERQYAYQELAKAIREALTMGINRFISGGGLGGDQLAARIVIASDDLWGMESHLTIARPFPSQDSRWNHYQRLSYAILLNQADRVVDVNPDPPTNWKYHARNRWMVDHSDYVIAVFCGGTGGTATTFAYAKQKGRDIFHINPFKQKSGWLLHEPPT